MDWIFGYTMESVGWSNWTYWYHYRWFHQWCLPVWFSKYRPESFRRKLVFFSLFSVLTLNIARNSTHVLLTLAIPMIVIAFLTLAGFLLPAESGEKIGFQITLLLAMIVFLEMVSSSIPIPRQWNESPKLIVCFLICIIILAVTIAGTDHFFEYIV